SQLSRSVEQRGGDKRPVLSDLRESGAIEQDADIVSFIYRPEYYGFIQDEEGNSNQGVGEIIVAKHRNGALDRVRLRFIGEYARFDNIQTYSEDINVPTQTNLNANTSVDSPAQNSYTIPSKMNQTFDEESSDFGRDLDDTPPF
ncbi:MAG: DnaB-like helicase C-terminal domain-containing protein, partial [Flavobacteriia bacterium]